jgi:hypothetical protein
LPRYNSKVMFNINLVALLLTEAYLVFATLRRKEKKAIHNVINSPSSIVPNTISEIQSEGLDGRIVYTFIFCSLGFNLSAHLFLTTGSYYSYIHFMMPLISLYPTNTGVQTELLLYKRRNSDIFGIIHKYMVILYTGILTVINTYFERVYILLLVLSLILYYVVITKNKHCLNYELFYFLVFTKFYIFYPIKL